MMFQGPIQPIELPDFTKRERDMIAVLALSQKVAAHRLGCSISNVKLLIAKVCQKLGVADRQSALVRLAAAGVEIEVTEATDA